VAVERRVPAVLVPVAPVRPLWRVVLVVRARRPVLALVPRVRVVRVRLLADLL
jgi:hypothetical protein